jgi:endonuclease VIII
MEGPSLIILKDEIKPFKGKRIVVASGLAKIDYTRLVGQKIRNFKTSGKHFLLEFPKFSLRIHFLMFGSYRINQRKEGKNPSLHLKFDDGRELNFYTSSVREIDLPLDGVYDWSTDVMNKSWDAPKARRKLKKQPELNVSDALLDQDIFAGVGNIIKNEVLFRIYVHPESVIGALPPRKLTELVAEAKNYSFDFLKWKKVYQLRKHWLIFTKKKCPRCNVPSIKRYTGKTERRTFFCAQCQVLYLKRNQNASAASKYKPD